MKTVRNARKRSPQPLVPNNLVDAGTLQAVLEKIYAQIEDLRQDMMDIRFDVSHVLHLVSRDEDGWDRDDSDREWPIHSE